MTPTWLSHGFWKANPTCNLQVFCNIIYLPFKMSQVAPRWRRWPQDGPKMAPRWPQEPPRRPQDGAVASLLKALGRLLRSLGRLSEPSSSHRGSLQKPIARMSKKCHPYNEKYTFRVRRGAPKTTPRRLKKVSKTARYNNSRFA